MSTASCKRRVVLGCVFTPMSLCCSLNQRWIDNWSYRLAGGVVHARGFRFGGEQGGFPAVVNYAPYACTVENSPFNDKLQVCVGGPPRSGDLGGVEIGLAKGSSIILEGCMFDDHGSPMRPADVWLEEIPAQLVIRAELGVTGQVWSRQKNLSAVGINESLSDALASSPCKRLRLCWSAPVSLTRQRIVCRPGAGVQPGVRGAHPHPH